MVGSLEFLGLPNNWLVLVTFIVRYTRIECCCLPGKLLINKKL